MTKTEKRVFLREATGLVREVGLLDALSLNLMNIGFGLGAAYILSFLALAPGGDPVLATLMTALMFVPLGLIYAMLLAAMPRSGADYVFISRSIHPTVGYIMNFTGTVWFFFWTGAFVNWVFTVGLGPAFSLIGWVQNDPGISAMASVVTSDSFVIGAGIALLVILGIVATVRKGSLFKIITVSLIAGVISVALMMILLATSSNADFISRFNLYSEPFAGNPDYYHEVISTVNISSTFSWQQTAYLIPVVTWMFMYVSAQHYAGGEIKRPRRNSYLGILLTFLIGTGFTATLVYLALQVMGYDFLAAIAVLPYVGDYKLPVIPYYNFLVGVLSPNAIVLWIVAIFFIGWSLASAMLAFVILPRELLASSMDRITPSILAKVSDRFHTPYVGIWLVVILSCIMVVLYTLYASFFATLSAVLANLICVYLPISIAAIVFPLRSATKPIFEGSPVNRKVGGVPVISIAGVLSTIVVLYIGYMFLTNDAYAANSPYSLLAILLSIVGALAVFGAAYLYHRSQGLDIMMAFREIPPE